MNQCHLDNYIIFATMKTQQLWTSAQDQPHEQREVPVRLGEFLLLTAFAVERPYRLTYRVSRHWGTR